MATDRQIELARENLSVMCKTLDEDGVKYQNDGDALVTYVNFKDGEREIPVMIKFNTDISVVSIFCPANIDVPEDYRANFAEAVSRVNFAMLDGCYDFDPVTGAVIFRINACYEESVLGAQAFRYLVYTALQTSNEYHPVLKRVVENRMSADQIVNFID